MVTHRWCRGRTGPDCGREHYRRWLVAQLAAGQSIEWDAVADGLSATYRAARRNLKRSRKKWRAFHAWRRRTKELTYQLELIARHAGERTAARRDELDALGGPLGAVVDLIMLREMLVVHGTGADRDHLAALLEHIDEQIDDAIRTARREGKALFDRGARKFTKKVTKAARRDLEPRTDASNGNVLFQAKQVMNSECASSNFFTCRQFFSMSNTRIVLSSAPLIK